MKNLKKVGRKHGVLWKKCLTKLLRYRNYPIHLPLKLELEIHKEIIRKQYETKQNIVYDADLISHMIYCYFYEILNSMKNNDITTIQNVGTFESEIKDITVKNGKFFKTIQNQVIPIFKMSKTSRKKALGKFKNNVEKGYKINHCFNNKAELEKIFDEYFDK